MTRDLPSLIPTTKQLRATLCLGAAFSVGPLGAMHSEAIGAKVIKSKEMTSKAAKPVIPTPAMPPEEGPKNGISGPYISGLESFTSVSHPSPFWVSCGMKAVVREVAGAVVVVEEDALPIMGHVPVPQPFFTKKLRVTGGNRIPDPLAVPAPEWNNPMIVRNSAGNVLQRSFALGSFYF